MEYNKTKNLDYAELTKYSYIAFHIYSLHMKEINLLKYNLTPVYKNISEEETNKIFEPLSPNYVFKENFKEKYNKLIEPINTNFALFLKFSDKDYFSLFGINLHEAYKKKIIIS